jgi:hypothetical protein
MTPDEFMVAHRVRGETDNQRGGILRVAHPVVRARASRRARIPDPVAASMLLSMALACGGDGSIAPPAPPPEIELLISNPFVGPRQQTRITVEVSPVTGDPIVAAWLTLSSGSERDSLPLPFEGDQPQGVFLDITVNADGPVSAVVQVAADVRSRRGATAEARGVFTIGDTTPPTVRWTYVDDTVRAGQTAFVGATYEDASGLVRTELHVSGAVVRDETHDLQGFPTYSTIAFQVDVPARPGDSIVQRAAATDMYGLRREIRQVYHIAPAP